MKRNEALGDISAGTLDLEQADEPSSLAGGAENAQPAPLQPYSGLSALIQAATSQLGDLADVASTCRNLTPPMVTEGVVKSQNFPDKLMTLCADPGNSDSITFLPDGKFFAIRRSSFEEKLNTHFDGAVSNYEEFLDLAENWGFSAILDNGIAILRHPCFVAGDYEKCARIRYGESPEAVRMHALPERARVVVHEDCFSQAQQQAPSKRRLSPGHTASKISVSSLSSSRQKVNESDGVDIDNSPPPPASSERKVSSGAESELSAVSVREEDNIRSVALAITTEKLKIKNKHLDSNSEQDRGHLVEAAVTSATHEIVTDAITTLLRDEGHSKETFLKHEKELSRSSIPGVTPVCKQIFSPAACNAAKKAAPGSTKSFAKISPTRVVTNGSSQVLANCSNPAPQQEDDSRRPAPSSRQDMSPPMIIQDAPNAGSSFSPVRATPPVLQEACNTTLPPPPTVLEPTDQRMKSSAPSAASSSAVAM